jgi:hypothetical protein
VECTVHVRSTTEPILRFFAVESHGTRRLVVLAYTCPMTLRGHALAADMARSKRASRNMKHVVVLFSHHQPLPASQHDVLRRTNYYDMYAMLGGYLSMSLPHHGQVRHSP